MFVFLCVCVCVRACLLAHALARATLCGAEVVKLPVCIVSGAFTDFTRRASDCYAIGRTLPRISIACLKLFVNFTSSKTAVLHIMLCSDVCYTSSKKSTIHQ